MLQGALRKKGRACERGKNLLKAARKGPSLFFLARSAALRRKMPFNYAGFTGRVCLAIRSFSGEKFLRSAPQKFLPATDRPVKQGGLSKKKNGLATVRSRAIFLFFLKKCCKGRNTQWPVGRLAQTKGIF